jgi:thioredoxin-like negative regulator of GroEL
VVTTDPLEEAAALIKAGKIVEAQEILHPFIRANPQNVDAWLLETETWNTAGKLRVLEICLEHNPGNARAQQALKDLLSAHQERLMRLSGHVRALESAADTHPRRPLSAEGESLSAKFDRLTSELEKSRRLMEQVRQNFDRLQGEVDSLRKELAAQDADPQSASQ